MVLAADLVRGVTAGPSPQAAARRPLAPRPARPPSPRSRVDLQDLLNPPADYEKRKHKLKRLVQSPNSFFMDVKCQARRGAPLLLRRATRPARVQTRDAAAAAASRRPRPSPPHLRA